MKVWSQLAEDDEKEVIYAVVDVDTNRKVGTVFQNSILFIFLWSS